jgi:hypothetical protein
MCRGKRLQFTVRCRAKVRTRFSFMACDKIRMIVFAPLLIWVEENHQAHA